MSVITINKNDPGLSDTLRGLSSQRSSVTPEVIVVDASEGHLDYLRKRHPEVRWIDFPRQTGTQCTIPQQRNAGLRAATGDIIVFIDASCRPADDWLERLLAPLLEEGEPIVAGIARSQGHSTRHDDGLRLRRSRTYLEECPTLNLAVAWEVFERIGGFDESFRYGSDVDFCWRAVDAGYRIRQAEDAVVAHDWGSMIADVKRSYRYGGGRAQLYMKHRKRWRDLFGRDAVALIYPLYILGIPLSVLWPFYWLLLAIPILRNWRYRPMATLVDHFVYAFGELRELARGVSEPRVPSLSRSTAEQRP